MPQFQTIQEVQFFQTDSAFLAADIHSLLVTKWNHEPMDEQAARAWPWVMEVIGRESGLLAITAQVM